MKENGRLQKNMEKVENNFLMAIHIKDFTQKVFFMEKELIRLLKAVILVTGTMGLCMAKGFILEMMEESIKETTLWTKNMGLAFISDLMAKPIRDSEGMENNMALELFFSMA